MNGYNFTERVRRVLAMSREEAHRLNHEYVGTEHILLGLVREGEGVAAAVLQSLSIDAEEVVTRIEATVKRGGRPNPTTDLPYTSRAKKVLELAMTEARELNHSYVGTEHLLLGLMREQKGIGAQVLKDVGLELEYARAEVLRLLGTDVSDAPQPVERRLWSKTAAIMETSETDAGSPARRRALRSLPPVDWFTDRARTVIGRARAEAAQRHSHHIEPEHLLIALLQEDHGMAATMLSHLRVDRMALARAAAGAVEETLATDEPFSLDIGYSGSAEAVLRHAFHEARVARDRRVGTDHLLIGLLLEPDAPASRVLVEAGLHVDDVRDERARIVG